MTAFTYVSLDIDSAHMRLVLIYRVKRAVLRLAAMQEALEMKRFFDILVR